MDPVQLGLIPGCPHAPVCRWHSGPCAENHKEWLAQRRTAESARESARPRLVLYSVTREMAEEMAGREITDEEAARIAKAIEYSTVGECVSEAVFQVCGMPADNDEDDEDDERD